MSFVSSSSKQSRDFIRAYFVPGPSLSSTHFSSRGRSQTVCWGSVINAIVALDYTCPVCSHSGFCLVLREHRPTRI